MVECHLLGMCRALLAQERKKVKRNPRETGCVCARTLNRPESLPQPAGREQPTARLVHPATQHDLCKMPDGNGHWLPATPKPPGRIAGENPSGSRPKACQEPF